MRLSDRGIDLIKEFEGLALEAYQDIVGVWTIGYGHTSDAGAPVVTEGLMITRQEAEEILRKDLEHYEAGVRRMLQPAIEGGWVTQGLFDAMVSLAYNCGVRAISGSTAVARINGREIGEGIDAIAWWNKAGGQLIAGLVRRRAAEQALARS